MPVQALPGYSRLQLRLQVSSDPNNPIYRTRTYANVKPDSSSEDLYQVASALGNLYEFEVSNIIRVDEVELVESPQEPEE